MQPTKELANAIYWERVQKARRMSLAERVRVGFEMFDRECAIMADAIRAQYPMPTNIASRKSSASDSLWPGK